MSFTRTLVPRALATKPSLSFRAPLLAVSIAVGVGGIAAASSVHAQAQAADAKVAIRAVQNTLPSVAILGQKPGPADTTEVFIQVPGVLNMQSVYVLDDGKTVISGVVVPPIENGFPGAQLSLPDGKASVDPRAPRQGVDQLNQVLGVSDTMKHRSAAGPAPTPAQLLERANRPLPSEKDFSVPALPQSSRQVSGSASGPAPAAPAATTTAKTSAAPGGAPQGSGSASTPSPASATGVVQQPGNNGILIESLSDVAQSGAFSRLVGHALENDSDIEAIRALEGQNGQRDAYLELVKAQPAIVQGDADKRVYALFDPNCPVCHRYYQEVSRLVDRGELEVHWIPAIVFPDNRSSLTASAALLAETQRSGGNPMAMLQDVMTKGGYTKRIDSAPNVDRLVPYLDGVVKNTAIMAMARAETPLLVFENIKGEMSISPGIPRDGYEAMIKRDS